MAILRRKKNWQHWTKKKVRNILGVNLNVTRSQEDYITQVSEEIEGRVTKKLSQVFSRTDNRILGALARLDFFLMNPLLQSHSGTVPETSRNAFSTSQRTNDQDSQSDLHPEAGTFHKQKMEDSGPEKGHDRSSTVCKEMYLFLCAAFCFSFYKFHYDVYVVFWKKNFFFFWWFWVGGKTSSTTTM